MRQPRRHALLLAAALLAALEAAPVTVTAQQQRESVNFDFGWRFLLGEPGGVTCPPNSFPKNLSGVECMGLQHAGEGDPSAELCADACCGDTSCMVWQWEDPATQGGGCWMGDSTECTNKSPKWVGAGRTEPGPVAPTAANKTYDDSAWRVVNAPHDFSIEGAFNESTPGSGQSYLPRNVSWYRKHFNIPSDWEGSAIWVYFEGVWRSSTLWLNGEPLVIHGWGTPTHDCGYTSFAVRLDNASGISFGDGKENENVLALYVDAISGSGWWYEGSGLYRHVHIVKADPVHVDVWGAFVPAFVTGTPAPHDPKSPASGLHADAMFSGRSTIINQGSSAATVTATYSVYADGAATPAATGTSSPLTVASGASGTTADVNVTVSDAELWSIPRPYLYTVVVDITNTADGTIVDSVNVTVGARSVRYEGDSGMWMNDQHVKVRGFCDHNDFTGVGMAVPDRVNLFRAQSLRSVGGNGWRMSHNPPIPVLLDILDRVGITVMDENRVFGNESDLIHNFGDMLRRDRNHPSVSVWSFCNEAGCERAEAGGPPFEKEAYLADGTRNTLANMFTFGDELGNAIDVQGFSHRPGSQFDQFHAKFPHKASYASECCSCMTMRGEDVVNTSASVRQNNMNADCVAQQTNYSNGRDFVVGTMVWTLFDYFGESHGWPHVSSSYGSFDLAGFAKAAVHWYRSWWLSDVPETSPDRPPLGPHHEAYIVQSWEPSVIDANANRTLNVYSADPTVELFVNGASLGKQSISELGYATFVTPFAAGNVTAAAYDASGAQVATHTRMTAGAATKLVLSIDAPSVATGTGSALVADGEDAALIRATVVDANGNVVPSASNSVTFSVASGPGRVIGTGNGDPRNHEAATGAVHMAYHGLVRAIVQVTQDSASPAWHRERLIQIDAERGNGVRVLPPSGVNADAAAGADAGAGDGADPAPIVVSASSPGLGTATISIPVSNDMAKDGVLPVAARSVGKANMAPAA